MSQTSPSAPPQLGPPIQLTQSPTSENGTPTKRFGEKLSQERARKQQRVSHYPAMVDVVTEPKAIW